MPSDRHATSAILAAAAVALFGPTISELAFAVLAGTP